MSETPGADTLELERELRALAVSPLLVIEVGDLRKEIRGAVLSGDTAAVKLACTLGGEKVALVTPDNILRLLDALASLRAEKEELRRERDAKDALWRETAKQAATNFDAWLEDIARAEAAESLLAEAGKALEPFAAYLAAAAFDLDDKGNPLPDEQGMGWTYLTVGDFRRARSVSTKIALASNAEVAAAAVSADAIAVLLSENTDIEDSSYVAVQIASLIEAGLAATLDQQVKHMVERFLRWRLPENFNPDCGISFKATYNENSPFGPSKAEPVGTNLFDYTQAEAMVRHMLDGLPVQAARAPQAQGDGVVEARRLRAIASDMRELGRPGDAWNIEQAADRIAALAHKEGGLPNANRWSYSINYGPDGEDGWANLTSPECDHVANIRTHHAKTIVAGLNRAADIAPPVSNWVGWRSIDTAPEDQHVILCTSGGHVGEAIMLIDEDTGQQKWAWALGPVHPSHTPYGWQPLPAALNAPVASDLRPCGFDGPTGAE